MIEVDIDVDADDIGLAPDDDAIIRCLERLSVDSIDRV